VRDQALKQETNLRVHLSKVLGCVAAVLWLSQPALAAPDPVLQARVEGVARTIAAELAALCPLAAPGSSAALEQCRRGLLADSEVKLRLPEFVLWGRQRDPKLLLKDAKLTQFAPDVLTGMYLPLFMFNGKHSVVYVAQEDSYQIRLQTAFRNRLAPGEFPYPFWHEAEKWGMYEKANEVIFYWDAKKERFKVAQFTVFGDNEPLLAVTHVEQAKFDGQWVWTDAAGKTQPKVTLFDGLFRSDNPYLGKLDTAYRSFALRLREGQCNDCHVPNNPDGMKKLVLLQSPMHTAGEIKRVLKAVREDRMPRDDVGIAQPMEALAKAALLKEGVSFDQLLDAARLWDSSRSVAGDALPAR
jgi:hypothetical protein